jgi:hypothetical protein
MFSKKNSAVNNFDLLACTSKFLLKVEETNNKITITESDLSTSYSKVIKYEIDPNKI